MYSHNRSFKSASLKHSINVHFRFKNSPFWRPWWFLDQMVEPVCYFLVIALKKIPKEVLCKICWIKKNSFTDFFIYKYIRNLKFNPLLFGLQY